MIQIKQGAKIENPRRYDDDAVESLRKLLEARIPAQRDPSRKNFYVIESSQESYYFLVSPISGNVVLLAKWLRLPQDCCLSSCYLVA